MKYKLSRKNKIIRVIKTDFSVHLVRCQGCIFNDKERGFINKYLTLTMEQDEPKRGF